MAQKRSLKVAIVGAGMSGLCMAAKLQDAGIDTFTIFEKADEVGGTWRDNTYPGSELRRAVALLLVFVPAQSRLVAIHVAGTGDPGLLPAGRRPNAAFADTSGSAPRSRPRGTTTGSGWSRTADG